MNRFYTIILSLALIGIITGCREKKSEYFNITGYTQGSTYSIVYEDPAKFKPDDIKASVQKILHDFDRSLSIYNDSSIISRINRNEDVRPDSFFIEVFNKSRVISQLTGGAFDITVAPLVKAWGFGPDEHKNFDVRKLDIIMKLVGYEKVSIVNGKVVKSNPGISLDVNAIAQGYSSDVIYRYFDNLGIKNFLIEIGGEVRAKGGRNGEFWKIGIDKPVDNNMSPGRDLQAIIKIRNKSLSTSGNYRKFYIENGIKYSHTIDPKTGYPAKNRLLSATIIADDCATADGIATACMVMGKEKAIQFISLNENLEAYFVFSDDQGNFATWATENLRINLEENIPNQ